MIAKLFQNVRHGSHKIRSLVPLYGVWGTILLVAKNTLWVEVFWLLQKEISSSDPGYESKIPIQVKPIQQGFDLDQWADRDKILKIRGDYGLEQFKSRLERGDQLFSAYWGDRFVGFIWLQFPPVRVAGRPLMDDEAYQIDGWTFEEYRGKGVLPTLLLACIQHTRDHLPNIKWIVFHVATWNKSSLSGSLRAGYKLVRKELGVSILGFHRKFVIPGSNPQRVNNLA